MHLTRSPGVRWLRSIWGTGTACCGFRARAAALGERAEAPVSGFASPWPAAAFVYEARGDRAASERLLDQLYAIESDRGALSSHLSPLIIRTLILRGDLGAARERANALERSQEHGDSPLLLMAEAELVLLEERGNDLLDFADVLRGAGAASGARYLAPAADRVAGRAALGGAGAGGRASTSRGRGRRLPGAGDGRRRSDDAARCCRRPLSLGRHAEAEQLATEAREPLERAGYRQALERVSALLAH